jgi:hypothetical protein
VTHRPLDEFLDSKTADQLAKFIRLIFISDQRGEITNAIAAVQRLLASQDRDAHWLAERLTAPPQSEPSREFGESPIWWCFHRRHLLAPGDRKFIEDVAERRKPLSPKQQKWLHDIVGKLENRSAA